MADYTYAQAQTAGVSFVGTPDPATTFGNSAMHLQVTGIQLRFRMTGDSVTIGGFNFAGTVVEYSTDDGETYTEVDYGTPGSFVTDAFSFSLAQGTYDVIVRVAAPGSFTLFCSGVTPGDKFLQIGGTGGTVARYGGNEYCVRATEAYVSQEVPATPTTAGDAPCCNFFLTDRGFRVKGDFTTMSLAQTIRIDDDKGGWYVYRVDTGEVLAVHEYDPALAVGGDIKVIEIATGLPPNVELEVMYKRYNGGTVEQVFNLITNGPIDTEIMDPRPTLVVLGDSNTDASLSTGPAATEGSQVGYASLIQRFNGAGRGIHLWKHAIPGAAMTDLNHLGDPVTYPQPRDTTSPLATCVEDYIFNPIDGAGITPLRIIILAGTNDFGNATLEQFEGQYEFAAGYFHTAWPTVPIDCLSIPPKGGYDPAGTLNTAWNPAIEAIAESFASPLVTFWNTYELTGTTALTYATDSPDNLHWTPDWHERFAAAIRLHNAATEPVIDPAGGSVPTGQEITLTIEGSEQGFYTVDDSTPTEDSDEYNPLSPPTLDTPGAVTFKARSVVAGKLDSTVASETYTVESSSGPGVSSVTINESAQALRPNGTFVFTASISVFGGADPTLIWSTVPPSAGFVRQDGRYEALSDQVNTTLKVRATSAFDRTKYDEVDITISGFPAVTTPTKTIASTWQYGVLMPIADGASASPAWYLGDGQVTGLQWEAGVEGNRFYLEYSTNGSDWTENSEFTAHDANAGSASLTTPVGAAFIRLRTKQNTGNQALTGAQVVKLLCNGPDYNNFND